MSSTDTGVFSTFRRQLFKEHLGLIKPQDCPSQEPVTRYMRSVIVPIEYEFDTEEDQFVTDPLDEQFEAHWKDLASTNAAVYQDLFHCTPAKGVKTWKDYEAWVPKNKKVGHVALQEERSLEYIKTQISKIRGHLTECPLGQYCHLLRPSAIDRYD